MLVESLAVNSEEDIIREPDTSLVQHVTYDIYDQSIKLSEEPYGAPQQRSLVWAPSHTRDRYQSPQSKEIYIDGARQQETLYLLANGQQHGAMMPLVRLDEMNPTTPLDRAEYYRSRYRSHTLTPVDASPATLQSRIDFAETVWQAYINGQIHSYRTSMFGEEHRYKCKRTPGVEASISVSWKRLLRI